MKQVSIQKQFFCLIGFIISVLFNLSVIGQEGLAGSESPFSIGYSAKALGMGNAQTAYPGDPTAFYWNPGAMGVVGQTGVAFSHTLLFEGVFYSSVGMVYPTMNAGTFGLGLAGIGIGGIRRIEDMGGVPVDFGEMQYWWGKLTISYAILLGRGLSVGANFNEHRQVLGPFSTYGFGMDAGLHFVFQQKQGLFKNLNLGINMDNALPVRLKLGTVVENMPYTIHFGVAKVITLRNNEDSWLLIGDVDQTENKETRTHFGTEYSWNERIFLRAGIDNGQVIFGGGLRVLNFQLDYAYAQIGDPEFFAKSHRFSLNFYIGKSIRERRRLLEESRQREVQRKIDEQRELDRRKRIESGLLAGKTYLSKEDYFYARLEFAKVLTEDSSNKEAQQLMNETTEKEQILQQQHEQTILLEAKEREKHQQDMAFVNQRFQEGLDALNRSNYLKAIEKWQQALERDSENVQIRSYLVNTQILLEKEVGRLMSRSKQLEREENLSEAYKALVQAKDLSVGIPNLNNTVLAEIKRLDAKVGLVNAFQAGLERYERGDYSEAAQFFEKATIYEPENQKAAELHRNAKARSIGMNRQTVMTQDVKEKFSAGLKLYQDGRYQEAIRIWEESLLMDPNNIKILDAIQAAKEKLATYQKQP